MESWLSGCEAMGLNLRPGCALPSYSERTGKFLHFPMSSTEATCWLREFLVIAGLPENTLHEFGITA